MTKKIPSSVITPEDVYVSRRRFIKQSMIAAASAMYLASCSPNGNQEAVTEEVLEDINVLALQDEQGNPLTSVEDIYGFTNFYEFSTSKTGPTQMAQSLETSPWKVHVGGLVNKPQTLDVDMITSQFDIEERIYRMRCVEAWSMVIPWNGFELNELIKMVEPKSEAKYIRFETLFDPEQMPGQRNPSFSWPYIEGLRMDEAMNSLTLLATGIYGRNLAPQNGAPIRVVIPWKYGFKSIKSIVRIDFVSEMPQSLWMTTGPNEYGFYANVNPNVNHPRWSQATERRIGTNERIETEMFNGYEEEVAYLYEGMDLTQNF